ncbi:type III-B CRISPR module RAMP protein Cmr1 [Myxococcota bacterium]
MNDNTGEPGAAAILGKLSVPSIATLPEARARSARGGLRLVEISVEVEVATPIFGGAPQTRQIDDLDVVRVPALRGHLRFWWRALCAHEFDDAAKLFAEESKLWGRAATDEGGRSAVSVSVEVVGVGKPDSTPIRLYGAAATPGGYALWPAKDQPEQRDRAYVPTAPRRTPATRFRLSLVGPKSLEGELRNTLRAWLLFGGYGSRVRRGLGSLTVTAQDARIWLPLEPTRSALNDLFGRDVLAPASDPPNDTPRLSGAALQVGLVGQNA